MVCEDRKSFSDLQGVVLHLPPIPSENIDITYDPLKKLENAEIAATTCILPFAASDLKTFSVKEARYLTTSDDVKTVIEISLDNKDSLCFKPGDTIGILPRNSAKEVQFILAHLNLTDVCNHQYKITLKDVNAKKKPALPIHIPLTGTLEYLLTNCIDIRSVLKKVFIGALSTYTVDSTEKRCLEELCSREGAQLYNDEIIIKGTSILDILKHYPSCKPPITLLIQHLPRLMPRPYSICNSPLLNKNVIKICFSVIEIKSNVKGLTTGGLETIVKSCSAENGSDSKHVNDLESNMDLVNIKLNNLLISTQPSIESQSSVNDGKNLISAYLRNSNSFCLPIDHITPIVMIALGTGISPFVGFLEERQQIKIISPDLILGAVWLYFGCRYSDRDYIYKERLKEFTDDGTLSRIVVSHSREFDCEFQYIQDGLMYDANKIVNLITEENANVYMCGDINKIAGPITECLTNCFVKEKNMTLEEAEITIKNLKSNNRFIQDIWS